MTDRPTQSIPLSMGKLATGIARSTMYGFQTTQILLFLGITVQLPVNVWIDNVGAIFMTENKSSSSRTRHMDTRYWYVHQLQEEHGLIKVNFVRTKDNVSDIGTKNVDKETYKRHETKLIVSKEDM